jgi:DNA-binding MarR family transcriptional regulator
MAAKREPVEPKQPGQEDQADQPRRSLEAISGFVADDASGDFQRLLNDRVRLGILSSLAVSQTLTFRELKELLQTTDGNLSMHARKLETADYISCEKTFAGRVPRTEFGITAKGRKSLNRYLKHMEAIIKATSE